MFLYAAACPDKGGMVQTNTWLRYLYSQQVLYDRLPARLSLKDHCFYPPACKCRCLTGETVEIILAFGKFNTQKIINIVAYIKYRMFKMPDAKAFSKST